MNGKHVLIVVLLLVLVGVVPFTVLAEISVGVKQGDWIEYDVTYTGTPPSGHAVTWAIMEIESVEGKKINVTFISLLSDGAKENVTENLNLETGQLIDYFIIPAGLKSGDTFFDKSVGNISISGVEVRTYAGATRTVLTGTTPNTIWYWDKSTGVLVEARSSYTEYTLTTVANKTGLWAPQIFGLDSFVFYALVIVAAAIIITIAIFVVRRKKWTHISTKADTAHEKPAPSIRHGNLISTLQKRFKRKLNI